MQIRSIRRLNFRETRLGRAGCEHHGHLCLSSELSRTDLPYLHNALVYALSRELNLAVSNIFQV